MPASHHLPSPSSSASLSPRQPSSHAMARHQSCSDDDSDHGTLDTAARSALEVRREKNRIKQRNLRLRRANQMADLEQTVQGLRSNVHDLEDRIQMSEAREASLTAFVRELQNTLIANGHREQLENLRRAWTSSEQQRDSHSSSGGPASRNGPDPLATLASAASSFQPRSSAHTSRRWEDDDAAATARKRRRQEDDYAASAHGAPPRLPSPSRMRIAELVLPLPRNGSGSSASGATMPPQSEHWGWNTQLPALDHMPYEHKPRINPSPHGHHSQHPHPAHAHAQHPHPAHSHSSANRAPSPADRRPLSATSSTTNRSSPQWASPVQSFEIRL